MGGWGLQSPETSQPLQRMDLAEETRLFQSLLRMLCRSGKVSAGPRAATVDGNGDDDRRSSVELSREACQEPQRADPFPVETAFLLGDSLA